MKSTKGGLLILYALLIIIPVLSIFFTTFKTPAEMYKNVLGIPENISPENYTSLVANESMGTYFTNSVTVTICSVILTLFLSSLIAFSITRLGKTIGNGFFILFLLGMMVPAQVNMIPLYQLMVELGLTNSLAGLIIVNTAVTMPVGVFILTGFMKSLPSSLFEASSIDGASNWKMYTKIAIPLSLPSLAATAIFLFVMHWNDLLYPLLLITDDQYKTLPLALLDFQGEYMTNYPMLFTGVILASAPMVIAYLFLQRYFIAGMTAGSVKG
ncbi:ABC transporter permease subunit [Bacillus lacus]|uniref:ABC transporter permease subunit n=1 Tax=Metabacillus lacus TaxID=1983721 RepID=A0A7X2LVU6_9BACI|nr:carbohydrate ABC transporter permease [Metabacillus lacus]MRX70775.1 ABC transporter permease subunit [Metabacillus lacus]